MPDRTLQRLFLSCRSALAASAQPLKNRKAIEAITQCQTRDMGVSVYGCPDGHERWEQYHSCRHRSCYLCAQRQRWKWIERQQERLLAVPHFHVIFTLPHEYLALWRYNEALFARILFRASQQALMMLMADAQYGGVTPGVLMCLHTWGRQLSLHPHIHCLVTAGGMDQHGAWQDTGNFLLPSAVLRACYRGKVQALLRDAMAAGELVLPPDQDEAAFWQQYRLLYRKQWHVRIEERYAHGKGVMLYLARYCKGGPLNPEQVGNWDGKALVMRYRDHRDKRVKQQRLPPMGLIQKLLLHVPATGLHTVRYYGLYAPAAKTKHQRMQAQHGNLSAARLPGRIVLERALLRCKACGSPARLLSQQHRQRAQKGNSFIKSAGTLAASGSVQQGVETNNERGITDDTS